MAPWWWNGLGAEPSALSTGSRAPAFSRSGTGPGSAGGCSRGGDRAASLRGPGRLFARADCVRSRPDRSPGASGPSARTWTGCLPALWQAGCGWLCVLRGLRSSHEAGRRRGG